MCKQVSTTYGKGNLGQPIPLKKILNFDSANSITLVRSTVDWVASLIFLQKLDFSAIFAICQRKPILLKASFKRPPLFRRNLSPKDPYV